MDDRVLRVVVVESNNSLRTLLHIESRTRSKPVVSQEIRWTQIWEDLLLKWLNGDLVEVYLLSIDIG